MNIYRIRAESVDGLAGLLEAAQAGKQRPFVRPGAGGEFHFDGARIVYPWAETVPGEPVPDGETGEMVTPQVPTGFWLCEVVLREPDAELAALAET